MSIATLLQAIIAVCNAYSSYVQLQRETYVDKIEDEIDSILYSNNNDAVAKLRIKRLLLRKKRYIEQFGIIRPSSDSSD